MSQGKKKQNPKPKKEEAKRIMVAKSGTITLLFLCVIILLIGYIRIRLLSFPLERDEGEYAYFGQLILQGFPPYSLAYNLKLPGTYYSYALIMSVFGQSATGIHFGLLLFNLGSLIFLFLIVKKLLNDFSALVATATFGILSLSPAMLGQAAHATHFVTFYMLGGVYFLIMAFEKHYLYFYFLSGIMMGLTFLMKQAGLFFTLFGCTMIGYHILTKPIDIIAGTKRCITYILGFFLPVGIILLVLLLSGVFTKFWFWTVTYPGVYASRVAISNAWSNFTMNFVPILNSSPGLWICALFGLAGLFVYQVNMKSKIFIILFFIFSCLTVIPGFYFRSHYFIPLLPVIGILTASFFDLINQKFHKHFNKIGYVSGIGFFLVAGNSIGNSKDFFFTKEPTELCRAIYAGNPFTESVPIANYLRDNSSKEDKIFVLGSEPQIYFYSHRQSASGYIYMYDLVFKHKYVYDFQQEMFRDIEKSKPKFLVFVSCPFSWLSEKGISDTVFTWVRMFVEKNRYLPTCIADMSFSDPTYFAWNEDALRYRPKFETHIIVFKRPD